MVLWTVVPMEAIFPVEESSTVYEELEYLGAKVVVEKLANGRQRIVRILSTCPDDFLREDIQPGTVL